MSGEQKNPTPRNPLPDEDQKRRGPQPGIPPEFPDDEVSERGDEWPFKEDPRPGGQEGEQDKRNPRDPLPDDEDSKRREPQPEFLDEGLSEDDNSQINGDQRIPKSGDMPIA